MEVSSGMGQSFELLVARQKLFRKDLKWLGGQWFIKAVGRVDVHNLNPPTINHQTLCVRTWNSQIAGPCCLFSPTEPYELVYSFHGPGGQQQFRAYKRISSTWSFCSDCHHRTIILSITCSMSNGSYHISRDVGYISSTFPSLVRSLVDHGDVRKLGDVMEHECSLFGRLANTHSNGYTLLAFNFWVGGKSGNFLMWKHRMTVITGFSHIYICSKLFWREAWNMCYRWYVNLKYCGPSLTGYR